MAKSPTPSEKHSRPPLARMLVIHERLKGDKYPNASKLSRDLEVSTKTIHRDFEFMRDQMGLPIKYDAERRGYYYSELVEGFPSVQVSEGEVFALLVANKALTAYRGTPYEAPLQSAFKKITENLRDTIWFATGNLEMPVSFRSIGQANTEAETFQILNKAVVDSLRVRFEYKKIRATRYTERYVEPLHLCCVDNQWYVVTYDLKRKARRTFALPRMRNLQLTSEGFRKPKDFSIEEHLKTAFGIFVGEAKHDVTIRFSGYAAGVVREKYWHPTQEIREIDKDTIEVSVKVSDLYEVERWVLSWGAQATVLKPKKLRDQVQQTLTDAANNYHT